MLVNMLEAKNNLSRFVAAAKRGDEVIIARDDKSVAKIVAICATKVEPPGGMKGHIHLSPDWDTHETNGEIAAIFEEHVQHPR